MTDEEIQAAIRAVDAWDRKHARPIEPCPDDDHLIGDAPSVPKRRRQCF